MNIAELNTTEDDQEIMNELLQHNPVALEKLHNKYRAVLKSIIMQVLHDDADAEDVLQDVFIQVWDRAKNYSADKGKLLSWLATLARRRAIDRVRQHSAYRRATDRFEVASNHPDKDYNERHVVESDVQRHDLNRIMKKHINQLPPPQRQVILMTFFEGRNQREISSMTGTPLGTVKTRIELGIKKLSHSIGGMREKIV